MRFYMIDTKLIQKNYKKARVFCCMHKISFNLIMSLGYTLAAEWGYYGNRCEPRGQKDHCEKPRDGCYPKEWCPPHGRPCQQHCDPCPPHGRPYQQHCNPCPPHGRPYQQHCDPFPCPPRHHHDRGCLPRPAIYPPNHPSEYNCLPKHHSHHRELNCDPLFHNLTDLVEFIPLPANNRYNNRGDRHNSCNANPQVIANFPLTRPITNKFPISSKNCIVEPVTPKDCYDNKNCHSFSLIAYKLALAKVLINRYKVEYDDFVCQFAEETYKNLGSNDLILFATFALFNTSGFKYMENIYDTINGRYKSRGVLMITGKENYELLALVSSRDFVGCPEVLVQKTAENVLASILFWNAYLIETERDFCSVVAKFNPQDAREGANTNETLKLRNEHRREVHQELILALLSC